MVLNSTVIADVSVDVAAVDGCANTAQLLVNTTDFNNQDFNDFLSISEGIERTRRQRRSNRRSRHNTIVATMTREEIFESTNLDDDQFLNALEHQSSYNEMPMTKTVLQNSIENMMKYFDEDIAVDGSSAKSSPAKLRTKGKVASAMASLRSKAGRLTPSPLSKRKNKEKLEVNTNIQELKKVYELTPDASITKTTKSLKLSPKFLRKSKVKQMAILFNTKINSIIRKDSPESQTPEPNSPGLESITSPNFTSTLKPKSPKLKPKMPSFVAKLPSPKPSPFFKRRQLQKSSSTASLAGSPFTRRKQLQKQPSTTCLVAENVFSQLTVKDKALLYNKFIADMSKKNPKFSKHGQVLESNVQKEIARGEVVIEKQGTVKHIRDSLEAKFTPKKQISKTLQRFKRTPSELSFSTPTKSKEFEDILRSETPETPTTPSPNDVADSLHVSTLTVVLKPSPVSKKSANKPRCNRKKRDVRFLTDLGIIEPSFKRTQGMIRSSVQVEPFAPPKKIRRTQHERLAPKMFFQNQHLEKLFYNWLKEKNGVAFDITPLGNSAEIIEIVPKNSKDNVIPKHQIDQLLEQAIDKLEAEDKQSEHNLDSPEEYAIMLIKKTVEEEIEKSVIEVELPLEVELPKSEERQKQGDQEDSDLGLTSIIKTTSEESHTELSKEMETVTVLHKSSLKSSKPIRKKKLKRSLTWKKDASLVETSPITSTDSDSDCKSKQQNTSLNSATLPKSKSKKCSAYVKKLLFKTINSSEGSEQSITAQPELSIVELDHSLIRQVNSPSKIKNAYTLTVMSSPSPPTESDFCDSDLPAIPNKDTSRSWPSLQDTCSRQDEAITQAVSTEFTDIAKNDKRQEQTGLMADSFIDLGFETGSNDMDSPMRLPRKASTLRNEKDVEKSLIKQENPKYFSTPLQDSTVHQVFTAQVGGSGQQNFISPITANATPIGKRKNLTMQVIKEDYSLEDSSQSQYTPSSLNDSVAFFPPDATQNTTPPPHVTHKLETSQFWINAGDFTAALNIHYYEPERLMLLSNIFGQKCMEHRDMTFGIDKLKFSPEGSECPEELLRKVPKIDDCSQYWFCTGDVLLPFAGKQISQQKAELFFGYIREFMDDGSTFRFGIDTYEFSNVHQSGYTNDFASHTWHSVSPVKTSDLDHSDFESLELEQSLSYSALAGTQSDSGSLKSEELINSHQTYVAAHDETDGLDQIFEDARNLNLSKTQTDKLALETQFTVPEILKTLQNQQLKLKTLEERMLSCGGPRGFDRNTEHFSESPEYMRKLRSIIAAIDNIGRGNGFNACSIEQLESFMFFLSRYADLCLANCTAHIEKILDVVMHQRLYQA